MIKLNNVSKYYYSNGLITQALRNINLEFNLGEFIAITGESGSGKSTLLNVISGIDSYEDGVIYINGEETSSFDTDALEEFRKNKIAFVFQNHNLIDSYSVLKNIEATLVIQGLSRKERITAAKQIIEKVGLSHRLKHRASKLSGGEKQRLAIARALAKNTDIIIADEPTGNLDSESGNQVLELLSQVSKEKLVLLVTHNYPQVEKYVTRKIRIFNGEIVEDKKLKDTMIISTIVKDQKHMNNTKKALTLSLFNIFGQPFKSAFIISISFALVFFVFAIYSSSLMFKDPAVRTIDFLSAYPERLIIKKQDDSYLTEDDYNFIASDKRVGNVIKEDAMIDVKFQLKNKFDYFTGVYDYGLVNVDKNKIIGRLPEKDDEILISTFLPEILQEGYIDYIFDVNMTFQLFTQNHYQYFAFKVVGIQFVEEEVDKVYITKDAITTLNMYFTNEITTYIDDMYYSNPRLYEGFKIDKRLKGNEIIFDYLYLHLEEAILVNNNKDYRVFIGDNEVEFSKEYSFKYVNIFNVEVTPEMYDIYLSQELYDSMRVKESKQYTINLKNKFNYLRVSEKLLENGYNVYSPFYDNAISLETSDGYSEYISSLGYRFSIYLIIIVVYIFSYLIYMIILRTKTKDYTIFKILGANNKLIKRIIYYEFIVSNVIAYGLFFGLYMFIGKKFPMLENYIIEDYIVIVLLNLVLTLLIASIYFRTLRKRSLYDNLREVGDTND